MGHTPGPWTVEYEDDDGELYDDGVRIDSPEGPVAFNVIDCSAHLIAAAPDLLEACELLLIYLGDWDDMDNDTCAAARKAIAKAKGVV